MTETRPDAPPVQVLAASPRRQALPPGPRAMVIFGASGDLTRRLLVPALYNLARTGLIPAHFATSASTSPSAARRAGAAACAKCCRASSATRTARTASTRSTMRCGSV